MDKFKKNIFIPIVKVDDEERMVYGWASTPDVDSDGEIIKSEALEKALPNYMKFPTLREMHQPNAVGKTKQAEVTAKGMYIGAKVVDDNAWKKVKEDVYPAFSIGGNVIKRVGNVIHEIELVEISLVDSPANKSAVVELWKREKVSKNAETAYSMANLMISIKDKLDYYRWIGKETSELEKALELIKSVLVREAQEPEPAPQDPEETMQDMFWGKTSTEIQKKIEVISGIDFGSNSNADTIRKGVIIAMNKTAEELKKQEEAAKVKGEGAEPTPGTSATETPKKEEAPATTEAPTEPAKEQPTEAAAGAEEKEAGELEENLQKVAAATDALSKIAPAKVEKTEDATLTKALGTLAGNVAKMADTIIALNTRLQKLESQPAAPKSRSVIVQKTITSDQPKEEKKEETTELVTKKADYAKLEELYTQLGANEFAKQGFSKKAMVLQDEIRALEGSVK